METTIAERMLAAVDAARVAVNDMIAYGERAEMPAAMRLEMMMSLAKGLARVLESVMAGGAE